MTNEGNKGERTQEGMNQTRKQNEPATQKPGGEEKERITSGDQLTENIRVSLLVSRCF
jgi:hypothetical protein